MRESANVKLVQDIYAAFNRGNIGFIIDQLTDDVRWVNRFDPIVPWGGDYSGKAKVPKFFQAIADSVEVLAFEPEEDIAQGQTVVSTGEFACRVLSTGKSSRTRWAFIWKFRDGKVSEFEQFHDPAIAAAFAGKRVEAGQKVRA